MSVVMESAPLITMANCVTRVVKNLMIAGHATADVVACLSRAAVILIAHTQF